jgi:hypothetical protein
MASLIISASSRLAICSNLARFPSFVVGMATANSYSAALNSSFAASSAAFSDLEGLRLSAARAAMPWACHAAR